MNVVMVVAVIWVQGRYVGGWRLRGRTTGGGGRRAGRLGGGTRDRKIKNLNSIDL